ncbi:ATP-binding protein [Paenibacillus sp. GP183]|uniref:two-component system sensor histidine kinase NtrB n=1 Tax=Paenibacillus sp. GP183 TaxID=1882751 RepID=UPI00089B4C72|nr:ATP-binding protein [Paenibacillus sp. GP183]SEC56269.1 PAS domain S-box-containing protein [Paenibacillus sp. GP183]
MSNENKHIPIPASKEEFALALVEQIQAMLSYWDRNQVCKFANHAYQDWFGKSKDEMIGITMKKLLGPQYSEELPCIKGVLEGHVQVIEREVPFPHAGIWHILTTYTPDIYDGYVRGFYVHIADITSMKMMESELQAAKEKVEEYRVLKEKLMKEQDVIIDKLHEDRLNLIGKMASSMAHEIRNPLTSIAGFLKLIRQNILNRGQAQLLKYIDVIDDEFEAINMQITGFLSFSRNKAFEEKKIDISLTSLINSTLFLLIPRLNSENINFTTNIIENCTIHVQKISIQQVLSNIISNAIDALITINEQRELKILCNEDGEYIYISIINNGPKIPQELRESLFLPFMTNKENGTGLGLAICKEIMEKNNGRIDFYSNDEETCFRLSFNKQLILF